MTGDEAMAAAEGHAEGGKRYAEVGDWPAAQTHALLAQAYAAIASEKVHADIQLGGAT